jgi:demethylmenaquinone methyltransferase/2-methoxy-6-polyprenyl-1,4-benzoquinol methylase
MPLPAHSMTLSAPTPGAPEKAAVRSMFNRIAPRYDLVNRLLSGGTDVRWRRRCIDALALTGPARVLDVCTGTADLLLELLRRDPRHRALGVDLSGEMIQRGRDKLRRRDVGDRGAVAEGDAERLPVADVSCDGAVVAFGIRNVSDPLAALSEMRRVLRPGGVAVVLEFSMPKGLLLGRLYRLYFQRILPALGALISGDAGAYRYLPDSVDRFASPAELGSLMGQAGFQQVAWQPLTWGVAYLYRGVRPA